jgi:hypothetical protein
VSARGAAGGGNFQKLSFIHLTFPAIVQGVYLFINFDDIFRDRLPETAWDRRLTVPSIQILK